MQKVFFLFFINLIIFLLLSCSFLENNPRVVSVSISDGQRISDIESFDEIEISFSKAMNRYITESNITISGYYGKILYQWGNNDKDVKLILKDPVEKGNRYSLKIGKSCECAEGYDLGIDFSIDFFTYEIDEEFSILSTSPADGEMTGNLDGLDIVIEFSLPVDYTTIYDKVTVSPELTYNYSFSAGRKILVLNILQHVEAGEMYTVSIDKELSALDGKSLEKEHTFSFNTILSTEKFIIRKAVMDYGSGTIPLNFENYLDRTEGIEKDMELEVSFNADVYLHSVESFITIEPAILFHLEKPDNAVIRFIFDEYMTLEET